MSPAVGDTLVVFDVNRREPERLKVSRVGRKHFFVKQFGCDLGPFDLVKFIKNDGIATIKDKWGHQAVKTVERHERDERVVAAHKRLRENGVSVTDMSKVDVFALDAFVHSMVTK